MPRFLTCASLLTLALACSAPSTTDRRDPAADILPPASGSLHIAAGEGSPTLEQLVNELSRLTGVTTSASEAVRLSLRNQRLALSGEVSIPPGEVYPWVEGLLDQHGFVVAVVSDRPPHLLAIQAKMPLPPDGAPGPFLSIPAERVADLSAHPALLVQTVVELPHLDVRMIGNSLRQLFVGEVSSGMLPVAQSSSMILAGTGRQVSGVYAMLREIDEKARIASEAEAARKETR
jgi:hypothetical protein